MGLYRVLVPHGSRRDRVLWIGLVTLRKLREGPGPWLRAVKKGVFQLLPLAWRNRILRWSGEEQFFRRDEARHADADRSVERPGLVSVVLPVFDQADMLGDAIDSVLAQSYTPFELIVVDDGSRDDVAGVMRRHLGDPRVRLLTQPNQGLPKALSTGFESATGEFFTWTSADNLMGREQLTRLVAFLRERPLTAMVWSDYELIDDRGAPLVGGEFRVLDRTDPDNPSAVHTKRTADDLNRYEDNFIGPCFLYRGRVGRLLGDYNPELGLEDYDYWMRVNRLFRLEHLGTGELLYRYRVHDNTLSARARELKILERAKVLMGYERQRAAWCNAPLRVLADATCLPWLAPLVQAPDTLAPLPDGDVAWPAATEKVLAVVGPQRLRELAGAEVPANVAIAAFFADAADAHRAHRALAMLPGIAFGANDDVAARLAAYTRRCYVEPPGPGAWSLAVRFAANATFFRATRDPERLRRVVPTPFAAAPCAVLLQLDRVGEGGLERVVADLAAELLAAGHRVGLLAIDGGASPLRGDGLARLQTVRLLRRDDAAYEAMLREGGWQVVDAHASTFGAVAAARLGVPFVQTVHNSYVWYERAAIEAMRAVDAATAAYACVSAEALGYLDLRLQLDVQKALVLENGIAPAALSPDATQRLAGRRELGVGADDFVFLQVASLQPAKAHRVAVHALAALRRREPRAKLVCLGAEMNPLSVARVRGDVEVLGLRDAVVFAGRHDDAARFYALADAFLLPSYWEGCSLAVWEAVQAGLPMVLSRVGAAAEQLAHGHGELVEPPFASLFALDATTLPAVTDTIDAAYVERVAAAMQRVLAMPRRRDVVLPSVAQRRTMAGRKARLFAWLLQGGTVAGCRTMLARAAHEPR